jgi:hypothetical protein
VVRRVPFELTIEDGTKPPPKTVRVVPPLLIGADVGETEDTLGTA